MRALLVLYMVIVLKFGEAYGAGLYGDFYGLTELGGVFGALLADRLLGIRRAILCGGLLMGCGHLLLALQLWPLWGFGAVVIGSSLFAPNLIAQLMKEGAARAQRGVLGTVFLLLNAGAYFATPLCTILSEGGVWPYGFWLASFGMLVATGILLVKNNSWWIQDEGKRLFQQKEAAILLGCLILAVAATAVGIDRQAISLAFIPWMELSAFAGLAWLLWRAGLFSYKQVVALGCYLAGLTLFYAFEEHFTNQVYAMDASSSVWGLTVSSAALIAFNPAMVFCLEAPIDRLCRRTGAYAVKILLPFLVGALSFALLALGNSVGVATGGVTLISLGEVLIGSVVYWSCLDLAPRAAAQGMQMKIFSLASIIFALATSLGTQLCKGLTAAPQISMGGVALFLIVLGTLLAMTVRYATLNHADQ